MKKFLYAALFFAGSVAQSWAQGLPLPVCNWGALPYKAATIWDCVPPANAAGAFLQTQGPSSPPLWTNQAPQDFLLPTQATNTFLGNTTGGNVSPTPNTVSQILDTLGYDIVRPPIIGSIVYKSNLGGPSHTWQALQPGVAGSVLVSGGAGGTGVPYWGAPVGGSVSYLCHGVDSTTALQTLLNDNLSVTLLGSSCPVGALTIPSNAKLSCTPSVTLAANAGLNAPFITMLSNSSIDGCHIDGTSQAGSGGHTYLIYLNVTDGVSIKNCLIEKGVEEAIYINDSSNFTIDNNVIQKIGKSSIFHSYSSSSPTNVSITNNTLDRSDPSFDTGITGDGIFMYGGPGARTLTNLRIVGNRITGRTSGASNGIELLSFNGNWPYYQQVVVAQNQIYGFSLQISVGSSPTISVANNVLKSAHGYAIEFGGNHGGSVTGNSIVGGGVSGGVLLDAGSNVDPNFGALESVTGNSVTDVTVCFQVLGNVTELVIAGNTCSVTNAGIGNGVLLQNTFAGEVIINGNYFEGTSVGSAAVNIGLTAHPVYITNNKFVRFIGSPIISGVTTADVLTGNHYDGVNEDFRDFAMVVTSTGGSFSTPPTVNKAYYYRNGNGITLYYDVTISDATGATGTAVLSLPLVWNDGTSSLTGVDLVFAKALTGYRRDDTHTNLYYYDGTTPIVTGSRWVGNVSYRTP